MKKQVIVIHGGETFETHEAYISFLKSFEIDFDRLRKKGWKSTLVEQLGEGYEVIIPQMPCKTNAKYLEWKIWFDKFFPILKDNLVLVGHSLGGTFLAKYLSENTFPRKIKATILIAAPFDEQDTQDSLADFLLPENLDLLQKQGGKIFLYHSKDDPVVPFKDIEKYVAKLPQAEMRAFQDRQHFNQEEFPELVQELRAL